MVVVVNDAASENKGDLVMAGSAATYRHLAFMVRHGTGIVCAQMSDERSDELRPPLRVTDDTDPHHTGFTVSVDHPGTSTGVSAADRAATLRTLADPATSPEELSRPGHVFPLRSRPGSVIERAGHTEAAGDLIEYRRQAEAAVERVADAALPIEFGMFRAVAYRSLADGTEHCALVIGDPSRAAHRDQGALVCVHSECLTGGALVSLRCDCGAQLRAAMDAASDGSGVVVYLRGPEGRGIGLAHKIRAYELQDGGLDTVDAKTAQGPQVNARSYEIGAHILHDLGVTSVRLITNSPVKRWELSECGITVRSSVRFRLPRPSSTSPTCEPSRGAWDIASACLTSGKG